ncbi:helix-hairpin-helix domain-containing protein [Nocardioides zeae]
MPGRHAARRGARPGVLDRLRGQVPSLALLDRSPVPELPYAAEPPPTTTGGGDGPGPGRGSRGAPSAGRRVAIGPPQVAVLAVLVAVALAATCWWVLVGRADEQVVGPLAVTTSAPGTPLATAADPVASTDGDAAAEPGSTATGTQGEVVVHVAGRVARPGVVVLPGGSRVADAVEAAGGTVPDTDLTGVNLARVLVDGEQVLVGLDPSEGAPGAPGAPGAAVPGAGGGAPSAGGLVDLNTADLAALDLLPGVGPVTAQAIIDWREQNGGFSHVDELLEVKGIGEATLAELAPLVTV